MKAIILIIFLLGVGFATGLVGPGHPIAPQSSIASAVLSDEAILRASVNIRILAPYRDGEGNIITVNENGRETALNATSTGLGTLVNAGGRTYLITHDHYAQLDASLADVIITTHDDREFHLSIQEFRALIRYRNNSTLIMEAPAGLAGGVSAGNGDHLAAGSEVRIVYRRPETNTLAVVPAVVDGVVEFQGIPSLMLRNLNGEVVYKGNSGGGVWHNGRLIGNIHRTIMMTGADEMPDSIGIGLEPSHRSYATRLSPERMTVLR